MTYIPVLHHQEVENVCHLLRALVQERRQSDDHLTQHGTQALQMDTAHSHTHRHVHTHTNECAYTHRYRHTHSHTHTHAHTPHTRTHAHTHLLMRLLQAMQPSLTTFCEGNCTANLTIPITLTLTGVTWSAPISSTISIKLHTA